MYSVTNSDHEQNLDDKKKKKKIETVSLASLVRNIIILCLIKIIIYIFSFDMLHHSINFILIGTAGGLAHGVLLPLLILVFGNLLNTFTDRSADLCTFNFTALAD